MFYANGEPATKQAFKVSEGKTDPTAEITDRDGRANVKIETASTSTGVLQFEVIRYQCM